MKPMEQELDEAIQAADHAYSCLNRAYECLQSAGNWGIFDMLGGGALTTFFKHSKIEDARHELERAKQALQYFSKELDDVNQRVQLQLDIGGFLTFADYFFDGIIADWLVQSRIRDAQSQLRQAMEQVLSIRSRLIAARQGGY